MPGRSALFFLKGRGLMDLGVGLRGVEGGETAVSGQNKIYERIKRMTIKSTAFSSKMTLVDSIACTFSWDFRRFHQPWGFLTDNDFSGSWEQNSSTSMWKQFLTWTIRWRSFRRVDHDFWPLTFLSRNNFSPWLFRHLCWNVKQHMAVCPDRVSKRKLKVNSWRDRVL